MGSKKRMESEGPVRIRIRVQPGASRNEVVGWDDAVLRLRVAAPPVEGRANVAVVELLAAKLGIAKGQVRVASGARARMKVIVVEGMGEEEVRERLR